MGKKRFAGTLYAEGHSTTANKYGTLIDAWIRGWDYGIEVVATIEKGEDVFEIYVAGGSTEGRSRKEYIGRLTKQGFVRPA